MYQVKKTNLFASYQISEDNKYNTTKTKVWTINIVYCIITPFLKQIK